MFETCLRHVWWVFCVVSTVMYHISLITQSQLSLSQPDSLYYFMTVLYYLPQIRIIMHCCIMYHVLSCIVQSLWMDLLLLWLLFLCTYLSPPPCHLQVSFIRLSMCFHHHSRATTDALKYSLKSNKRYFVSSAWTKLSIRSTKFGIIANILRLCSRWILKDSPSTRMYFL